MYLSEFRADAHVLINSKFKIMNRIALSHFFFVYVYHGKIVPCYISVLTSYTFSHMLFSEVFD